MYQGARIALETATDPLCNLGRGRKIGLEFGNETESYQELTTAEPGPSAQETAKQP